jgi:hypothetical protein
MVHPVVGPDSASPGGLPVEPSCSISAAMRRWRSYIECTDLTSILYLVVRDVSLEDGCGWLGQAL